MWTRSMEEGAECAVCVQPGSRAACMQGACRCSIVVRVHVGTGRSNVGVWVQKLVDSIKHKDCVSRCRSSSVQQRLRQSVSGTAEGTCNRSRGPGPLAVGSQCCVCCGAAVQRCRLFVVQVDLSSSAPGVRMWSEAGSPVLATTTATATVVGAAETSWRPW